MKKIVPQSTLIEIQTYFPNEQSRGDLSTSRVNLIHNKNKEESTKRSDLKIKTEFRALLAITKLRKIMIFIYFCLAFDFSKNLYQSYLMTYSLMDILEFQISPIYVVRYSTSLFNAIGLLKIIIEYKDYRENEKKNKISLNVNKNSVDADDTNSKSLDVDFELNVPMPIKEYSEYQNNKTYCLVY